MTPEIQAEVAAIRQAYEQTVMNLAHEHANMAAMCAALNLKLQAANKEIAELKAPKEAKKK